jgi:hypothetical protein
MKLRIGHPAEHLPHWKQRLTELPDSASTFRTNPRFIVSVESCILACFTDSPFLPRSLPTCAGSREMTPQKINRSCRPASPHFYS